MFRRTTCLTGRSEFSGIQDACKSADVSCSPPYKPEDKPNPLNLYGKLKEAGEQAVLSSKQERKQGSGAIVLRVPLL
jgi:dTDP-4-dehydrorhamnose reductase